MGADVCPEGQGGKRYTWWKYIKAVVQAYPSRRGVRLSGVAWREREAVRVAIEATQRMVDGQGRLKIIRLLHWDRTHTLEGAALAIPCSRRTAARWQRQFFEEVARGRDLID